MMEIHLWQKGYGYHNRFLNGQENMEAMFN